MGLENCEERVLFQLTHEKSPTTGTSSNASYIFVIIEDDEDNQPIRTGEKNKVNFCKKIFGTP